MPDQFPAEVEKLSSGFTDEIVLRDGDIVFLNNRMIMHVRLPFSGD